MHLSPPKIDLAIDDGAVLELGEGRLSVVPIDERLTHRALTTAERSAHAALAERRQRTWLAGRVALRQALGAVGAPTEVDLLPDDRGAPRVPQGFAGSIAHKDDVAVAFARPHDGSDVGVDVEHDEPLRVDISRKIMTDEELARVAAWSTHERARAVRVTFAVKEAIYKAIDPVCRRYVAFTEVELDFVSSDGGVALVKPRLDPEAIVGPPTIAAAWGTLALASRRFILAFATARWP
ncbi:MAG: 4'-phosphopantetheinyl transferase superfamily protein [Polyangiaceae bacterium]